jgi:3-methyladenine DNA glycosylase Tag
LRLVYPLMLETLGNIGINIDEELTYYRELSNDDWTDVDYFEALTRAVFGGIRNGIIEDRWRAISEAFSNFDFYAVAKYDQAKMQELMQNDKIIRNRVKIEASVENAEKMVQIVRRYGSFKRYINFFSSIESLVDALPSYHDAYKKEFWTLKGPRTEHVRHITLRGDHNNNKMERMNGEVRDREKVLRGLKKDDSAMLSGYQLYHNYLRPHEGLNGKTPSEACGIKIEGENKWKTLIQNASKKEG